MPEQPVVAPDARVLTLDAVRWGIAELKRPKIHRHFFAYLYLCRLASRGDRGDIQPVWDGLEPYYDVYSTRDDVIQEKHRYLPINNQNVKDASTYWLNNNWAGSYGISSIRGAGMSFVVNGKLYELPNNHGRLALKALLYDKPVPAAPVAAYLLRNFAFDSAATSSSDLVEAFKEHFGFTKLDDGEAAFTDLFAPAANPNGLSQALTTTAPAEWFESWSDWSASNAEDEEVADAV